MLETTRSGRQHSMCGLGPPSRSLPHSSRTLVKSLLMSHCNKPAGLVWKWFGTFIAVVLLSATRPVVGQTVIGSVLDANTSAPLPGAAIATGTDIRPSCVSQTMVAQLVVASGALCPARTRMRFE